MFLISIANVFKANYIFYVSENKRRMSVTSEMLARGPFPPEDKVPHNIITVALYFAKMPSVANIKVLIATIYSFFGFSFKNTDRIFT